VVDTSNSNVHMATRVEPQARSWLKQGLIITLLFLGVSILLVQYLLRPSQAQGSGSSLRFYGNGAADIDRAKIQVDDPTNSDPGPPADIGATDMTLEFWMKANAAENPAGPIACGQNTDWIFGHVIVDRDRFDQDRKFGLSVAGGTLVFGVSGAGSGDRTICGTTNVLDGNWHHVALQRRRSDGWMWLYVDGTLEAQQDGPDGDISYPDDALPAVRYDGYCQGPDGAWGGVCENDPYLVIGAEKHDAGVDDGSGNYPSYSGWIDEIRLSTVLRYASDFSPPSQPFTADVDTAALYHLDEGSGLTIADSSNAPGGPSDGTIHYGGSPAGPEWSADTPFGSSQPTQTPTNTPTDTPTPTHTPTSTPTGTLTPTYTPTLVPTTLSAITIVGTPQVVPAWTFAAITWFTNIRADSRVRSGRECSLWTREVADTTLVITHTIVLTGLEPNTTYCFGVQSGNDITQTAWTSSVPFTTSAAGSITYLPLVLIAEPENEHISAWWIGAVALLLFLVGVLIRLLIKAYLNKPERTRANDFGRARGTRRV
jgi:hypothetical protein